MQVSPKPRNSRVFWTKKNSLEETVELHGGSYYKDYGYNEYILYEDQDRMPLAFIQGKVENKEMSDGIKFL